MEIGRHMSYFSCCFFIDILCINVVTVFSKGLRAGAIYFRVSTSLKNRFPQSAKMSFFCPPAQYIRKSLKYTEGRLSGRLRGTVVGHAADAGRVCPPPHQLQLQGVCVELV